jgi:hypothetical protein
LFFFASRDFRALAGRALKILHENSRAGETFFYAEKLDRLTGRAGRRREQTAE